MEITKEIACRVLSTVDAGLVYGLGRPTPGEMCVEAAVCYALGQEHGDEPSCVSPALRAFKIRLNDAQWSSAIARARGLRRLALIQLGSTDLNEVLFATELAKLAKDWACRAAADYAAAAYAAACAAAVAYAAAYAAAAADYAAADRAAARATWAAAEAADYAATRATWAAAEAADGDKTLSRAAEDTVQLLIKLDAPGAVWLDLAPLEP
jgi:hypothetical protein